MFEFLLSVLITAQFINNSVPTEFFNNDLNVEVSEIPTVSNIDDIIDARSYLSVEKNSNVILFEKESNKKLPMASLTKLMTVLLILENHKLGETVYISRNATQAIGSKVWLYSGDSLSVLSLLKAALIKSWNDSAVALAEHHSSSVDKFVKEMNNRAKELNMINTNFKNPHGLDDDEHYSSARDILILTRVLWKYRIFRNIVKTKEANITTYTGRNIKLKNTNKLLSSEIKGVKTGTTDEAGQCLVLYVDKDNRQFFTIVLWSYQRFSDSKKFIDTIWKYTQW